jgi:long-chain fatty acid transport protein
MNMKRLLNTVILMTISNTVFAAGFYLSEVASPHSLGTAGVANPTNIEGADNSWSNPAGMTYLEDDQLFSGLQLVLPSIEFDPNIATGGGTDGGNAGVITPIPSMFYVKKYSDKVSLGISLTAAIGGGVDYGNNFAGRYATSRAELGAVGVSPSIAYKVNDRLSVGAGVSIIYTMYETDIAINPAVLPTVNGQDGKLSIEEATDFGFQPFFSLNYELTNNLLLGVVYRAEMDVELDGDVKVENVAAPIGANQVDVDWDNPQWLEMGLKYTLSDKDELYFNAGWQDWSEFSNNTLAFSGGTLNPVAQLERNWDDTWHAGIAYTHKTGVNGAFGFGFSYDSSPVDGADRTFDLPADEIYKFSGAYAWQGKKNLDFSVGGTLYVVGDAEIDNTSQGVRVQGEYENNLILFMGATVRYLF